MDQVDIVGQRATARIGCVLRGKWRIDHLLGIGGMAAVYAGTHRNGKRGAIKLLHLELSLDAAARSRFLQEGYVANKVAHPGAVSVLDDDVAEDGSVFLVMELLEGRTLEKISQSRPTQTLETAEVLAVAVEILDVLAAAHDKGIVHRDLKPDNIFITHDGRLKVLDFGLARVREIQPSAHTTKAGEAMGTPAFMPPEQALGNWDSVDARTDLWAVGAMLFTLLTGRLVHVADTINKLLLAAMTKPAPPIRSIQPDVPKAVAAIIDRALAFERNERWPDARAMQQAVREAQRALKVPTALPPAAMLEGAPLHDRPAVPGAASLLASSISQDISFRPKPSKGALFGAAAGVAALISIIAVVATRDDAPAPVEATGASAGQPPPPVAPLDPTPMPAPSAPTAVVEATPTTPSAAPTLSGRRDPGKKPDKPGTKSTAGASSGAAPKPTGSGDVFGTWN
jgi:serine/threonine-protein kinase